MTITPPTSLTLVKELRGNRAAELRAWWYALSGSGHIPGKADFKLTDWKKHLPWITAADAVRDAQDRLVDVSFKVFGTALVRPFGGDLSGKHLSAFGEPYLQRWLAPARVVESTREPVLATGTILVPEHDFQEFEVVILPLFDSAGSVERFLVEAELLPPKP